MQGHLCRLLQASCTPASPHVRQPVLRTSTLIPRPYLGHRISSPPFSPLFKASRNMSTSVAKKEFLCILPDKPGALAKRLAVRESHLANAKTLTAQGTVVAGGAMLESHPAEGEAPQFKGSMMMAVGESEAEIRALLESDIYAREGVWDLEKAQIIPYKSAVRQPL